MLFFITIVDFTATNSLTGSTSIPITHIFLILSRIIVYFFWFLPLGYTFFTDCRTLIFSRPGFGRWWVSTRIVATAHLDCLFRGCTNRGRCWSTTLDLLHHLLLLKLDAHIFEVLPLGKDLHGLNIFDSSQLISVILVAAEGVEIDLLAKTLILPFHDLQDVQYLVAIVDFLVIDSHD